MGGANTENISSHRHTSSVLNSASFLIEERCKIANDEFMLCKANNRDPAACLEKAVTASSCAASAIRDAQTYCPKEFLAYWNCMDDQNQRFQYCRNEELALAKSYFEKTGFGAKHLHKLENGELPSLRKMW